MREALGLHGGFLGGRVRASPRQPRKEFHSISSLLASPKALASAFSDKEFTASLEDDLVMFPGRIPRIEALGDDGGIDMSWRKVREATLRPFSSSVLTDWVPCPQGNLIHCAWHCVSHCPVS